MIYYRRNTFSDKAISFMGVMLGVIFMYNNVQRFQILGNFNVIDLIVAFIGLGVGVLFLYTSRFKYLEIEQNKLVWYTCFFRKHTLTKDQIKDITTRQRYYIVSRHKGSDIWISKFYIRKENDVAVHEALKKLIEGK
ncbi:MAG: hypothetical protein ACRCWY_07985 [Cellulosilyticaceae bacterium]